MKERTKYLKIVYWSEEDQCFIGQCPGIIGPCCHGDNKSEVHKELCQIVAEWLDILEKDDKGLSTISYGNNIVVNELKAA